jgi:hypothetical protein
MGYSAMNFSIIIIIITMINIIINIIIASTRCYKDGAIRHKDQRQERRGGYEWRGKKSHHFRIILMVNFVVGLKHF